VPPIFTVYRGIKHTLLKIILVKDNFGERAPYVGPAVGIYAYINLRNGEKLILEGIFENMPRNKIGLTHIVIFPKKNTIRLTLWRL